MPHVWLTQRTTRAAFVLLHGFTGAPENWRGVADALANAGQHAAGLWLVGHHPDVPMVGTSFDDAVDATADGLAALALPRLHVVGYSLGARLLLGVLSRHPHLCGSVTLIGPNPGLQTPQERHDRTVADARWSALLEAGDMAAFANRWQEQPIFASQGKLPPEVLARQQVQRLQHDPRLLAPAFAATSLARMPDYWPALAHLTQKVHYVAGADDAKFCDLLRRAHSLTPQSQLHIVPGCGHNPVLEAPGPLGQLLLAQAPWMATP